MGVCARCGEENRAQARFCDRCGAPLAEAAAREERKVVSVLFADLVGFTGRAEELDPEDVRALQDPYWRGVRAEIERHGGTVEKFIGDAVVALFGAPVAHEDDPERAVRAALAIRDWARERAEVKVRVAVTTGEALVRLSAQPLAGEGMASGDVVNTASRLQAAAPANSVVVDERSYRSTRQLIDYDEASPIRAKGKAAPVSVWEALRARSRFGVDVFPQARTRLVGREREVDGLTGAVARARHDLSPQLVTLVGVPGIGKSRLVYELSRWVDAQPELVRWRQGRSLAYGDGAAFWALSEIVKAEAGILDSDPDEVAARKLARTVQQAVGDEAEWVKRHLRPLVGLAVEEHAVGAQDEAFAAWRRFVEALADERLSILVFEDLHWADDGLLDFIENLHEWISGVPLVLVCTARPELLERRPTWSGGKPNAAMLALSPLTADDSATLIEMLIQRPQEEAERELLVDRIGGNPLYAEQFALLVNERETLDDALFPATVHGTIAARLDTLSDDEKRLLQHAAVFGTVFWSGAFVRPLGTDQAVVDALLHSLDRKEFIRRSRRCSVAGETEYAFRHVLLRDVAYGQLPRGARAEKHQQAAAWLESLPRPDDHSEMLAHHYLVALELASAAGSTTVRETARVRALLVQAGDRTFALNAYAAAARYFERALELSGSDEHDRPELLFRHARALFRSGSPSRADALERAREALAASDRTEAAAETEAMLAEVWSLRGDRSRYSSHLEQALTLVAEHQHSPAKARVLTEVARFQMLAGNSERAIAVADEALAMADSLGLDELRAQALITRGSARTTGNDVAGAADIERGLQIALDTSHLHAAARGYNNLADATEDVRQSRQLALASMAIRRRLGDRDGLRYVSGPLAWLSIELGDWDEALRIANDFIAASDAGERHYAESWLRLARATIQLARDDTDAALSDLNKALFVGRNAKDPQNLYSVVGVAARVYVELGRLDKAQEFANEIISYDLGWAADQRDIIVVARKLGLTDRLIDPLRDKPSGRRWHASALAFLEGRVNESAHILEELGAADSPALFRLRGAEVLLDQGSLSEARQQLEAALRFYRSVGAARYVREAEALLMPTEPLSEKPPAAQPRA